MNHNAPNYKELLKEYFNQKFFFKKKDISVFFIYEIYTLSIDFYVKYIYFKIILKNLLAMLLLLLRSMEY